MGCGASTNGVNVDENSTTKFGMKITRILNKPKELSTPDCGDLMPSNSGEEQSGLHTQDVDDNYHNSPISNINDQTSLMSQKLTSTSKENFKEGDMESAPNNNSDIGDTIEQQEGTSINEDSQLRKSNILSPSIPASSIDNSAESSSTITQKSESSDKENSNKIKSPMCLEKDILSNSEEKDLSKESLMSEKFKNDEESSKKTITEQSSHSENKSTIDNNEDNDAIEMPDNDLDNANIVSSQSSPRAYKPTSPSSNEENEDDEASLKNSQESNEVVTANTPIEETNEKSQNNGSAKVVMQASQIEEKSNKSASSKTFTGSNNSPFFDSHSYRLNIEKYEINQNHREVTFNERPVITNESIIQGTGDSVLFTETNQNSADTEEAIAFIGLQDSLVNQSILVNDPSPTGDKLPTLLNRPSEESNSFLVENKYELMKQNMHYNCSFNSLPKIEDKIQNTEIISVNIPKIDQQSQTSSSKESKNIVIDDRKSVISNCSRSNCSRLSVGSDKSVKSSNKNLKFENQSASRSNQSGRISRASQKSTKSEQSSNSNTSSGCKMNVSKKDKDCSSQRSENDSTSRTSNKVKLSYGCESRISDGRQSNLSNGRNSKLSKKSTNCTSENQRSTIVSRNSNSSSRQEFKAINNKPKCLLKTAEVNQRNPECMLYGLTNSPIGNNNEIGRSQNYNNSEIVVNNHPTNTNLKEQMLGSNISYNECANISENNSPIIQYPNSEQDWPIHANDDES